MRSVLFGLLSLCLLVHAPFAFAQEAEEGEMIVLADGTELFGTDITISDGGIAMKWRGMPMQVEWKLLDAIAMRGMRQSIVNEEDQVSLHAYGLWCFENGLEDEGKRVEAKYLAAYGRPIQEEIPVAPPPQDPEPTPNEVKDPSGNDPKPEQPKPVVKEPKPTKQAVGKYLPVVISIKKGDQTISDELIKALGEAGVTIEKGKAKGKAELEFKVAELEKGKHASFMGATFSIEYKGVAEVIINDVKGKKIASEKFDTGLFLTYAKEANHLRKKGKRSLAEDEKVTIDYAQAKARDALVRAIASWARGMLPREEASAE
ncbi:MAG: hypothetical protein KDB07_01200 [Planctomycetes bacterium]|nr:hypothetical protein [Planctomycetota bacterium]